ncbi:MAG: hypothetical protein K9N38_04895 [Candidatus Marinimicrobia bacterium]|nr:hypothetical protein [Candidatus Neomarinimicrobiota bacterium]MCF7850994.1 hypothetical protein [Candidatus Neomarinimicrobiota bacterium]
MKMTRLCFVLFLISGLYGQSALYRLGYGDLYPTTDPLGSSLGAGVVAYEDSTRALYHNPASLSRQKRVFFGAALGSDFREINGSVINNTRIEHVAYAAPIGSNLGVSLSLNAVSDFESEHGNTSPYGNLEERSSGGLWDYAFGLGYELNPGLKLGVKLHFLHGFLRRQISISSDEVSEMYLIKGNINGQGLEVGGIANLGNKVKLGVTADIPMTRPLFGGSDSLGGTSQSTSFDEELAAWPTTVKLGLVYKQSRRTSFLAGLSQQIFPSDGFDNAAVFALPAGWETVPVASFQVSMLRLPADRGSRNWLRRTGWQVGGSVKNYYLTYVSDKSNYVFEYALISGLNLGLRNGKSLFDISGEFGLRGGDVSLPEETYARLKLGIQVNDVWFKKVKRR